MPYQKILESNAKRISVIAAPGSGKTKKGIIPKVKSILEDPSIDPNSVLLLTFSRLSAKDLKDRVSALERVPRAMTVHSLCLAFLLSENNHNMRKRVESILFDFNQDALISDLKILFPQHKRPVLRNMIRAFSAGWAIQPHDSVFEENDDRKRFKAAIIRWLEEHEAAMMDEIVYAAVDLAKKIGVTDFLRKYQYIFIDEYQDLNQLEQEFIEILAENAKLLFVVGDPDQSIYSFKYSYPEGINKFSRRKDVVAYMSLKTYRCPKKIVDIANQLLIQIDPTRTTLLESMRPDEGEVHFVIRNTQRDEFEYILKSIEDKLKNGAQPKNVMLLAPKKLLGKAFVDYALSNRYRFSTIKNIDFKFDSRIKLSGFEVKRILLFSLIANPNSTLHLRTYLGLGDSNHYAKEIRELKQHYGNLQNAIKFSDPSHFSYAKKKIHALCQSIIELRAFLQAHQDDKPIDEILNELFPCDLEEAKTIRALCDKLKDDNDTPASLYLKVCEHLRTIPVLDNDIHIMTLMGSKGLEAEHVFIFGCNNGNIPGENRSLHLSEQQHKDEQRRLLFVGFTRASKTLDVSWARHIPFAQSKRHYTPGLGTIKPRGFPTQTQVAMCEFLQNISGISWER